MNKGFEVFNIAEGTQVFELEQAKKVLTSKIPESSKKQRTQGKTTLTYIGGHTVIRLLNEAFNYQWSFEIVSEEIVQSLPKFNKWAKKGEPTHEEQPPVAKVLGRLTVPGLGVKEQYGSKVLIGGATEQESAFKSASTDAMKKCASLFGIGLELYGEDEFNFDTEESSQPVQPVAPPSQPVAPPSQPVTQAAQTANPKPGPTTPRPSTPPAQPAQAQTASAGAVNPNEWVQEDIDRLKELKMILGITENPQLDAYVREFLDNPNMTYRNIVPQNVKAFNVFLAKKAETE